MRGELSRSCPIATALCGLGLVLRGVAERRRAAYVGGMRRRCGNPGSSPSTKPARARLHAEESRAVASAASRASRRRDRSMTLSVDMPALLRVIRPPNVHRNLSLATACLSCFVGRDARQRGGAMR